MKTHTRDGRTIQFSGLTNTHHDGKPCYYVEIIGDVDVYFQGGSAVVLATNDLGGGKTGVWYDPNDGNFHSYAQRLIELGAW